MTDPLIIEAQLAARDKEIERLTTEVEVLRSYMRTCDEWAADTEIEKGRSD